MHIPHKPVVISASILAFFGIALIANSQLGLVDLKGLASSAAPANCPLNAPVNLTIASKTSTSVSLTWTDSNSCEQVQEIWRSNDNVSFTKIGSVSANATAFTDSNLLANPTYYYKVRATANTVEYKRVSDFSNTVNVTLTAALLPAPVAKAATGVASSDFKANWTASTGATGYRLDVATNSSFTNYVTNLTTSPATVYKDLDAGNVLSFNITNLNSNTTYYYRLRAYNASGASSDSNTINVLTAPWGPTAKAATNITSNGFTANWSEGLGGGAAGYKLDVATDGSFVDYVSGYQNLDVGNVLSYNVTGLNPSATYNYRIRAYNSSSTSAYSGTIIVATSAVQLLPPAPSTLSATNLTTQSFNANWTASSGASGYRLDIATDSAFTNFVAVNGDIQNKDVGNVLSFKADFLASSTTFYYRVRAYNSNGTSANSNVTSVTTLAAVPPPAPAATSSSNITASGFTANWSSSTQANGYEADVSTNSTFSTYVTGYQNIGVGSALSLPVSGLNANTTYYWRVRAFNNFGRSPYSSVATVTTAGSSSSTYKATTDFSGTQGYRNWYYYYYNGGLLPMIYNTSLSWWESPGAGCVNYSCTGPDAWNIIYPNGQIPGTQYNSVRAWKAPASGTVTITGTVSDLNSGGGDGAIASVFKNSPSTTLWSKDFPNGGTGYTYNLTATVSAGDIIGFMVNGKTSPWWDDTSFDATIVLTP